MTEEIIKEIALNEIDKRKSEKELEINMISFANAMKNGFGEEMKQELINPPKPNKKNAKKIKRARFWGKIRENIKLLFFKKNNTLDDNIDEF